MADPSESVSDAKIELPSELFRTIVSLLLFVHLFSVGLGIVTSADVGTSSLLMRVKMKTPLLERYLWQFWLDRGYDYHLISLMPMLDETASYDWDNHLEATLNYADGQKKIVELPELGNLPSDPKRLEPEFRVPSDRRQRLQQLSKFLAMCTKWPEGPDPDEFQNNNRHLVAGSIGGSLLRQNPDATSLILRWYYHRGLTGPEVRAPEPPTWSPIDKRYFVEVGRMKVELSGDEAVSIDPLPIGEVSPLKPRSTSGKSSGARPSGAPATESPKASPKPESN